MRKDYKDLFVCIGCQDSYRKNIMPLCDDVIFLKPTDITVDRKAKITSQADLCQLTENNIDIGTAVLSSIKTDYGDDNPPLASLLKGVRTRLKAGTQVARLLGEILDKYYPDKVYMFNGRHFDSRPLLRMCQDRGIDFYTYEVEFSPKKFNLCHNSTPHSLSNLQGQFINYLKLQHAQLNTSSIINRINSKEDIYAQGFRASQKAKALPADFNIDIHNISILHSSEDEYANVDDSLRLWGHESFANLLASLSHKYISNKEILFYVRLHPRLQKYNPQSVKDLLRLNYKNVHVIPPDSSIDTFALACASQCTLCYGSTAGPEAILLGARAVCIGECAYSGVGMMPEAKNFEILDKYITNPELINCSKEVAAQYINFLSKKGEIFLIEKEVYSFTRGGLNQFLQQFYNLCLKCRIPTRKGFISLLLYTYWRVQIYLKGFLQNIMQ
ncbi:hypothetical protein [Synechococcus sp. EJ6-Ellesmere]|uniref:hypothetical protein n=1 Tax=Synechococcus sp. EJ6-Ellesmere TaxID=2823734 RepID=UPI0020CD2DCA|nr:hypothetical protein [Synechococcus sp. EJ6-Ellesmere]MCP9826497.1 hypothetical protein [Synechococcus sp. EJ6-Ellesmere]